MNSFYIARASTLGLGGYDVKVYVIDTGGGAATNTEFNEFNVAIANADPVIEWIHAWGTPEGRLDPGGVRALFRDQSVI